MKANRTFSRATLISVWGLLAIVAATTLGYADSPGIPDPLRIDRVRPPSAKFAVTSSSGRTALGVTDISTSTHTQNWNNGAGVMKASVNGFTGVFTGTFAGAGDVVGPASATDNAFPRYDGTTGKLLQDSTIKQGDTGIVDVWSSAPGVGIPGIRFSENGTSGFDGGIARDSDSAIRLWSASDSYGFAESDTGGYKGLIYVGTNYWYFYNSGLSPLFYSAGSGGNRFFTSASNRWASAADGDTQCWVDGQYGNDLACLIDDGTQGNYRVRTVSSTTNLSLAPASTFGVQIDTTGSKTTCAGNNRGSLFYQRGGAGVADVTYECRKDTADAYAWVPLSQTGGSYGHVSGYSAFTKVAAGADTFSSFTFGMAGQATTCRFTSTLIGVGAGNCNMTLADTTSATNLCVATYVCGAALGSVDCTASGTFAATDNISMVSSSPAANTEAQGTFDCTYSY